MGYTPQKDTKFSGTETITNLTANAGGNILLPAAANVTVPTITVASSTQKAVNESALLTYVAAQLSSYATTAAVTTAIDNAVAGLDIKPSVRLATTGAITLASRTSTALTTAASTLTLDGTAVVNGDRVLVKDTPTGGSSTAGDTGIFTVSGVGSTVVLTRSTDADAWTELPGALVAVEIGTANADKVWMCTADQGGTLGTTAQTWTQFGAGTTVASGITNTPAGNIAATNVQTALNELDTEKLALAGGTMTGTLALAAQNLTAVSGANNLTINASGAQYENATLRTSIAPTGLFFGPNGSSDVSVTHTGTDEITVGAGDTLKHDTMAAGTVTTAVATTAFVQRDARRRVVLAVANASFPYTMTATSGVPTADIVITQQTAAQATTLPAANAFAQGTMITVKDGSTSGAGTYNLTINRAGSDTIDGLTSFVLDTNLQSVDLVTDGTSKWYVV